MGGNGNKPGKPGKKPTCVRETTDHDQKTICAEDSAGMLTYPNAYKPHATLTFTKEELEKSETDDIEMYMETCQCTGPGIIKLNFWKIQKGKRVAACRGPPMKKEACREQVLQKFNAALDKLVEMIERIEAIEAENAK